MATTFSRHCRNQSSRLLLTSLALGLPLLVGCQPQEIWYQVLAVTPMSPPLKGADAKSEVFRRPSPDKEVPGSATAALYTRLDNPGMASRIASLKTGRISTSQLSIEHLFSYTSSWSWCTTIWSVENKTDHVLRVDTAKCLWLSATRGQEPRRPCDVSQRLGENKTEIPIADGKPLLDNEKQATDGIKWPVLDIPAKSRSSIGFTYPSWYSEKARFRVSIVDPTDQQLYECEFSLSN